MSSRLKFTDGATPQGRDILPVACSLGPVGQVEKGAWDGGQAQDVQSFLGLIPGTPWVPGVTLGKWSELRFPHL